MKTVVKRWLMPPGVGDLLIRAKVALKQRFRSHEERTLLAGHTAIRNRHVGERCFIIGGGASIKEQNLKLLQGECVLSVSNTFVHPDFPLIRPRYHVLPTLLFGHSGLYEADRFVGWLREMQAATGDAEMFFHIGDRKLIRQGGLFQDRIIHWVDYVEWDGVTPLPLDLARIPHVGSVSELAITVALYMGFDEIYLLGFDHDWFRGALVYFYDHKSQHAMKPDESKLVAAGVDAEFQMRRHADIFRKYKYLYQFRKNIYNANADSAHYLDVFPRVEFESLFESRQDAGG